MIQNSSLRKKVVRSIGVSSYSSKDIHDILFYVVIDHSFFLNLSCSNTAMLKRFCWEMSTWNSLPFTCYVWLQKPRLEEKTTSQSLMLDLFLIFQANRSKLEWKSWSKPNSLICSYINTIPCIEDLRLLKTSPRYCNWILILIWR